MYFYLDIQPGSCLRLQDCLETEAEDKRGLFISVSFAYVYKSWLRLQQLHNLSCQINDTQGKAESFLSALKSGATYADNQPIPIFSHCWLNDRLITKTHTPRTSVDFDTLQA